MSCIFHSCICQVGLVSVVSVWSGVARSSLHQCTIWGPCWTTTHCWLIQGLQDTGNLLPPLCSFCLFTTNVTIVSPIRVRGGCDESSCLLVWLFWWIWKCYPVPYVNQWLLTEDHVWQQQCERACLGLPALKAEKELTLLMRYCCVILPVCTHRTLGKNLLSGAVIYYLLLYTPSALLILQQTGLYLTLQI